MEKTTVIMVVGFIMSISVNVTLVARWSGKTSAQITAMQGDIKRLECKQDQSNGGQRAIGEVRRKHEGCPSSDR